MKESFIPQRPTPTSMELDLGCTRAMTSRVAAQDLMKFCDQNKDCSIWYTAETTSQFTFANFESTKCKQKLIMCMYDREYAVQSTQFGHVPALTSLPQMRNLRFQFDLHPDTAYLSSPGLGIRKVKLRVAPSSHLVLDLLELSQYMWHVRFKFRQTQEVELPHLLLALRVRVSSKDPGKLFTGRGTQESRLAMMSR